MKQALYVCVFLSFLAILSTAGHADSSISVIPQPLQFECHDGKMTIAAESRMIADTSLTLSAERIAQVIRRSTGFALPVIESDSNSKKGDIIFRMDNTISSDEGYRLDVKPTAATISAAYSTGAFYGGQTLLQLLPPDIFSRTKVQRCWELPCVEVTDRPQFAWRGLMLDSSRHFQNVDTIKRLFDLMAMHKLNVFHWHLIDSHGWRLEIKKYPRLTSVGGFRHQPPIGRHGGFYTQDEIRDLVRYASERGITIVPEIEMPGHSRAATAAYPWLACQDNGDQVGWFFGYPCPAKSFPRLTSSAEFCAGRETTFEFLESVLDEVCELFPSKYIHVGGDEVNTSHWRACPDCQARIEKCKLHKNGLQSYFMKRIERYLSAKGRKMIGWDEILKGGLAPGAAVMSWRGEGGGLAAPKVNIHLGLTTEAPRVLDHGQGVKGSHPGHWPGEETLEEVYAYYPVPDVLTEEEASHVLGCQGNIWSAFIHSDEVLDFQIFPRACALSEIAWSPRESKDYERFQSRLDVHLRRLDYLDVSYYDSRKTEESQAAIACWSPEITPREWGRHTWEIASPVDCPPADRLSIIFKWRGGKCGLDVRNVQLHRGEQAATSSDRHEGFTGGRNRDNVYQVEVINRNIQKNETLILSAEIQGSGGTGSQGDVAIVRGITGEYPWSKPRRVPVLSTTTPVTQNRDKFFDWPSRHERILQRNKIVKPDVVFFGDSITHMFGGELGASFSRGRKAWDTLFDRYTGTIMGFGWDRPEITLWRVRGGELDGIDPKVAIVLIGTNNLSIGNTPREIYWGVQAIVDEIHRRCPKTRVLLLGILPRFGKYDYTPERVNNLLSTLNDRKYVRFYNVNYALLDEDGILRKDMMADGVHPGPKGYEAIVEVLRPVLVEEMERAEASRQ